MLSVVLHLPVVMAAEKSRTAFYIIGGITAAWAVIVSLGIGLRRPDFPSSASGQRIVMAISAALVIATGTTGVITASKPSKDAVHPTGSAQAPGAVIGGQRP